jgi:hypothetical protein
VGSRRSSTRGRTCPPVARSSVRRGRGRGTSRARGGRRGRGTGRSRLRLRTGRVG